MHSGGMSYTIGSILDLIGRSKNEAAFILQGINQQVRYYSKI